MTIGILLHPYGEKHPSGLGRAILALTKALIIAAPEHRFVVYILESDHIPDLPNSVKICRIPGKHVWNAKKSTFDPSLDVYLFFTPVIPIFFTPRRSVVIVHDFSYLEFPTQSLAVWIRTRLLYLLHRYSLHRASSVVAVSEYTKRAVLDLFPLSEDSVSVVYNGYIPLSEPEQLLDTPKQFFLYPGTLKPRKNIPNILRAFAQFTDTHPEAGYDLVLTGTTGGAYYTTLMEIARELGIVEQTRFVGYVSDKQLAYLYHHAKALVFPSLLEGFGMPILEAMSIGLPVITSNTGAVAEIAGEAALLVEALSSTSIARAMMCIADNDEQRQQLARQGIAQAQKFSWEHSARGLLLSLEECVKVKNNGNRKRSLALLFSSFRVGGGERVMVTLANAFVERGNSVDVLVLNGIGEYKSHFSPSIRIIDFNARRMLFGLPSLISYLRREKPNVLIATDEYTHLLALGARAIARSKTRIALRIGNMFTEIYARYRDMKHVVTFWMMQHFYKHADVIIANSKGVADDIRSLTPVDPARVSVIYNPKKSMEIIESSKMKTGLSWLDEKTLPVVVWAGRLREQKNLPLLLRAFAQVLARVPARLVIVGNGKERTQLQALAQELGIEESLALVGYKENPYAFMAKADVCVLTSLWEGLPNSLIEALTCGVPVVATDCDSGPREILAPDTDYRKRLQKDDAPEYARFGILTPVNDERALAEVLSVLLTDSALRARYASVGRERSSDFDEEHIITQYESALGPQLSKNYEQAGR